MYIEELREIVSIDRRCVACRLGDEKHPAVFNREAPGTVAIRFHYVPTIADANTGDARLARVTDAIAIQIFEHVTPGRVRGGWKSQGDEQCEQSLTKAVAAHGVSP